MTAVQDVVDLAYQRFGTRPDYPWAKYPDYAVLRHLTLWACRTCAMRAFRAAGQYGGRYPECQSAPRACRRATDAAWVFTRLSHE